MNPDVFIHETADVEEPYLINEGTKIWRWTHIAKGVRIGLNCSVGQGCYIGPGVTIGNNVRIQNNAFIPELTKIGDDVFIGPHVVFTNDKYPPGPKEGWAGVTVENRASIGANSTLIAGVTVHEGAKIGAGSVVTKDVGKGCLTYGNPANAMKAALDHSVV